MKWQKTTPSQPDKPKLTGLSFNPFRTLLTPLLLITAAGIIAASILTYQVHRKILVESLLKLTEEQAHSRQLIIQNRLQEKFDLLLRQAHNLLDHHELRQEIQRMLSPASESTSDEKLKRIIERYNGDFKLTSIALYNNQGLQRYRYDQSGNKDETAPVNTYAPDPQNNNDIVRSGQTWILRVIVPISLAGSKSGFLALSLNLNQILDELATENQMKLVLANGDGIQAQSNAPAAPATVNASILAQVLANGTMQTQIDLQQKRLNHYMPVKLGRHRFILINEIDLHSLAHILQSKKHEIQQLTLLLLLGLLPASALVIHLLLRPLDRLRKRADGMVLQLTGSSSKKHQGHEIGRMVAAFDGMETALYEQDAARQKAEAKLQREHATLGTRVKERTSDLERMNTLLQR